LDDEAIAIVIQEIADKHHDRHDPDNATFFVGQFRPQDAFDADDGAGPVAIAMLCPARTAC